MSHTSVILASTIERPRSWLLIVLTRLCHLLHLLHRGAHCGVEVLAVRVAHVRPDVRGEAEVVKRERRGRADPDPLALLLEVDRLPFGALVRARRCDVAAGLADLLPLLGVADQPVAAVGAISPIELAVCLWVPHFSASPEEELLSFFPRVRAVRRRRRGGVRPRDRAYQLDDLRGISAFRVQQDRARVDSSCSDE